MNEFLKSSWSVFSSFISLPGRLVGVAIIVIAIGIIAGGTGMETELSILLILYGLYRLGAG